MKLLLVGHLAISTKLIIALNKTGINLSVLSTETESPISENSKKEILAESTYLGGFYDHFKLSKPKYTRFLFSFTFLIPFIPKSLFRKLVSVLKENDPEIVVGNWGTGILPEINLIKSLDLPSKTKVILNMETFPTAWKSRKREFFERYLLKSSMKNIDGLIVPTDEMYNLLISYGFKLEDKIIYRKPFYFPRSHFETTKVLSNHDEAIKDLIFLGKPDLFRSLNSVQNQLLELAESGITISCSEKFNLSHKNIFPFKPFGIYDFDYNFSKITATHKAALVTFKIQETSDYPLRFNTSLPHRFLFPLALGLPTVVPQQGFQAIGTLIDKYQIGYRYQSIEKLKEYLRSDAVSISRNNIIDHKSELDFNADEFKAFLKKF
ncbi:MAG: hypothetical protein CL662_03925 [Bacteroidetes bacterium]|jgi:hypothetical protein|nr:hypothetical protein [Bacteroidota bacterium]|tara:strand:- start:6268 stop:7404 length:1137 start_codon:yes stop_codon:yes gene_type:complete